MAVGGHYTDMPSSQCEEVGKTYWPAVDWIERGSGFDVGLVKLSLPTTLTLRDANSICRRNTDFPSNQNMFS